MLRIDETLLTFNEKQEVELYIYVLRYSPGGLSRF